MIGAPDLPASVRARVELLRDRARAGLTVTCGGVSMEPQIRRGELVHVASGMPAWGDVAAFVTRGGALEVHRLIARSPGLPWWVHAGDNQAAPHLGLVHQDQLVGVVPGHRRRPSLRAQVRALARLALAAARQLRRR
ncbi:MAG: S24/S26 family peptidase [Kofleriaceae bacterium]